MSDLVVCQICGYKTKNHQSFNSHITHAHHIKSKEYYDLYMKKVGEGVCKTCGKPTQFIKMWKGYRQYCCISCMSSNKDIQEQRKQTSRNHYGTDFPHTAQEVKDKMANTCMERFGANNVFSLEKYQKKIRKTNLSKYGVENPSKSEIVKKKMKETCISKYGTTTPLASNEIKQKIKETCQQKYGVNWTSQIPSSREKTKQTNLKKYGKEHIFQLERVRKKIGSYEARLKALRTTKANGTRSSLEIYMEKLLKENNISYKQDYNQDKRYPYRCDFYLPTTDTFIEINGYWMHGAHFFDNNNPKDLELLEKWKKGNTSQYNRAIYVWTVSDIEKRNVAIKNGINYVVLWNKQDITNFINSYTQAHFH